MIDVLINQLKNFQSQNREYFAQFLTEDIAGYISRKRKKNVHGNHIEIQAMSEIYNRPVELYCYQTSKYMRTKCKTSIAVIGIHIIF